MGPRACLACVVLLVGCGRVGFDPPTDAAATAAIQHVAVFVQNGHTATTNVDSFTTAAAAAGDAVVLHIYCTSNIAVTGVTVSAPNNWSWYAIAPFVTTGSDTDYGASFGAIAPDTAARTFTVTWQSTTRCQFMDELGDEFANTDPTGGAVTFDAHAENYGSAAGCTATLTTRNRDDAVWAACDGNVTAVGTGCVKGADDTNNDWSEYAVTTEPAGTPEHMTMTSAGMMSWLMTAVSIKPR